MKARIAPVMRGARWLGEGFALFRVSPLGWLALVFAYWLLMTLVSVMPLVGVVVASVLVPPFSVGFMAASRAAASGGNPEMSNLFAGFRERVATQLALGAVYTSALALLLAGTALADGGALARWMLAGDRPDETMLQSDAFVGAMLTAVMLYLPVMMMFWFAPVLAAWHGVSAPKALFYSFFACLMNWRAFLAYGAVTALVTVALPFVVLSAMMMASSGGAKISVMALLFPFLILLLPTLFASFYISYRDIFGAVPDASPGEAQPGGG